MALQINYWNCHGLQTYSDRSFLDDYIKSNRDKILCFQEAGVMGDLIPSYLKVYSTDYLIVIEKATHRFNGLAIMIPLGCGIKVSDVTSIYPAYAHAIKIAYRGTIFVVINVLIPQMANPTEKMLTDLTEYLDNSGPNPIIMGGDWNCTVSPEWDRIPAREWRPAVSLKLSNILSKYRLNDIWRYKNGTKKEYTWMRQNSKVRLDRIYITADLIALTGKSVIDQRLIKGDHRVVSLSLNVGQKCLGRLSNRHIPMWKCGLPECKERIKNFLNKFGEILKFNNNPLQLWIFYKDYIRGIVYTYKAKSRDHIQVLRDEYFKNKCGVQAIEAKAAKRALLLLTQSNRVLSLENGDECITDPPVILDKFTQYYSALYQKKNEKIDKNEYNKDLSTNMCDDRLMTEEISYNEIEAAIKQLHIDTAPGPDGYSAAFYKQFPEVIPILRDVYNNIYKTNKIVQEFFTSDLVMVPKVEVPGAVTDFRPISLINVDFKILTKVIANRLSFYLPSVISREQTCAVKNRNISENLMIVRDTKEYYVKKGGAIVSIDLSKAYDRVDHNFLLHVLKILNFPPFIYRWCEKVIRNQWVNICLNGLRSSSIKIDNGIRQGDALSPAMFIVSLEPLLRRIKSSIGKLRNDEKLPRPVISAYADDLTIMVENKPELKLIRNELDKYVKVTGAIVNDSKSKVLNFNLDSDNKVREIINMDVVKEFKILGIFFGENRQAELKNYEHLMSEWKKFSDKWHFLYGNMSYKERVNLVNSFFIPKIMYTIQIIVPPDKWVDRLMGRIVKWVNIGPRWPKRECMFTSMARGGLQIENLKDLNRFSNIRNTLKVITNEYPVYKQLVLKGLYNCPDPFFMKLKQIDIEQLPRYICYLRRSVTQGKLLHVENKCRHHVSDWSISGLRLGYSNQTTFWQKYGNMEVQKFMCDTGSYGMVKIVNKVQSRINSYYPKCLDNCKHVVEITMGKEVIKFTSYAALKNRIRLKWNMNKEEIVPLWNLRDIQTDVSTAWKLINKAGITPDFLCKIGRSIDNKCPKCGGVGTETHYFEECLGTKELREFVGGLYQHLLKRRNQGSGQSNMGLCFGKFLTDKSNVNCKKMLQGILCLAYSSTQAAIIAWHHDKNFNPLRLCLKKINAWRHTQMYKYKCIKEMHVFYSYWAMIWSYVRTFFLF